MEILGIVICIIVLIIFLACVLDWTLTKSKHGAIKKVIDDLEATIERNGWNIYRESSGNYLLVRFVNNQEESFTDLGLAVKRFLEVSEDQQDEHAEYNRR